MWVDVPWTLLLMDTQPYGTLDPVHLDLAFGSHGLANARLGARRVSKHILVWIKNKISEYPEGEHTKSLSMYQVEQQKCLYGTAEVSELEGKCPFVCEIESHCGPV